MVPEEGMTFEMEKYFKRLNPEMGMGRREESSSSTRTTGSLACCKSLSRRTRRRQRRLRRSLCAGASDGRSAARESRRVYRPRVRAGAVIAYFALRAESPAPTTWTVSHIKIRMHQNASGFFDWEISPCRALPSVLDVLDGEHAADEHEADKVGERAGGSSGRGRRRCR